MPATETVTPNPVKSSHIGTPLAGIKVVDWTHVLSGPYTGYLFSLLGADVVKVERSDQADLIRSHSSRAQLKRLELGEAFIMLSSGKRSLAVDARDPRAKKALHKLIGNSDVLVENFRPGKLAELGFSPKDLIESFPNLIICSISGFGQEGALSRRPAYDHIIQAMSGLMAANVDANGSPMRIGMPLVDYATGTHAALAILAALRRRDYETLAGLPRTCGEWLDVSMLNVALSLSAPDYASYAVSKVERIPSKASAYSGNPLSGTFVTTDGFLAIVCNSSTQSNSFLNALAQASASEAELFALSKTTDARNVEGCHAILKPILLRHSAVFWEALFAKNEVPAAQVQRSAQAYQNACGDIRMWPKINMPHIDKEHIAVPGPGFMSNKKLMPVLTQPPLRGEQSASILSELGLDETVIQKMFDDGVAIDTTEKLIEEQ